MTFSVVSIIDDTDSSRAKRLRKIWRQMIERGEIVPNGEFMRNSRGVTRRGTGQRGERHVFGHFDHRRRRVRRLIKETKGTQSMKRHHSACCRRPNRRSRQHNMDDCRTVCCVHGLVKEPCTNLKGCSDYWGDIVRELLKAGELLDSGERRNGQIVFITPRHRQ